MDGRSREHTRLTAEAATAREPCYVHGVTTKIVKGCRVLIDHELRVVGGEVIESSSKTGPLSYVQGSGRMLPGLEKRLEGHVAGDTLEGVVPAREAFGNEEMLPTTALPRAQFPKDATMSVGAVFEAKDAAGHPISFKVLETSDKEVRVRLLHPLAGKDISFKVKVLAVTETEAPPLPPGTLSEDLLVEE